MNEELYEIFEDVSEDEEKIKKIMQMQKADELYEYLKNQLPDLSESEFEDFIIEVLEQYKERREADQKTVITVNDDALENIAGGVNFGTKIAAAGLALMTFLPAVGATGAKGMGQELSGGTSISQNVDKSEKSIASGKFDKVRTWGKDNAGVIAGATVGTMVLASVASAAKLSAPSRKQARLDRGLFSTVKKLHNCYNRYRMDETIDKIDELIKKGANVNAKNNKGESFLQVALQQYTSNWEEHMSKLVKKLIESGADAKSVNLSDESFNELNQALLLRHCDVFQLLVEHGMPIPNSNRAKCYMFGAYRKADYGFFKLLLEKGAYLEAYGTDALNRAIELKKADIVKEVLKRGVIVTPYAINWKAIEGDTSQEMNVIIDELLGHLDINSKEAIGVLESAIKYGRNDIVKKLLDKGIDVKSKELAKRFINAAEDGNTKIVKKLLDIGVDVNAKGEDGKTALFKGCEYRDVFKELLRRGADINARDSEGYTALMRAVENCNSERTGILIKAGADVKIKNNKGKDGLSLVAMSAGRWGGWHHKSVIDLLLNTGKFSNDGDRDDAINIAIDNSNRDLAEFIRNHS